MEIALCYCYYCCFQNEYTHPNSESYWLSIRSAFWRHRRLSSSLWSDICWCPPHRNHSRPIIRWSQPTTIALPVFLPEQTNYHSPNNSHVVLFLHLRSCCSFAQTWEAFPLISLCWKCIICSELNSVPLNFASTWNLRMWSHLEIGALQMELVKMRSYWIRVGPKSEELCPYKKVVWRHRHTQGRGLCEAGGRDWSDAATSQGLLATTRG